MTEEQVSAEIKHRITLDNKVEATNHRYRVAQLAIAAFTAVLMIAMTGIVIMNQLRIRDAGEVLIDCTQPSGNCYQRAVRAQEDAVTEIIEKLQADHERLLERLVRQQQEGNK